MNIFGYVRVSSQDQNEDRQRIAMGEMKISSAQIFTDKMSGKNFERPAYRALVKRLNPGDLLYVNLSTLCASILGGAKIEHRPALTGGGQDVAGKQGEHSGDGFARRCGKRSDDATKTQPSATRHRTATEPHARKKYLNSG
ncbi:MAG: recombinase family protein [Clostridiales Family XIII bacterium]|jgi:hypothetical protein|nr:recombinase family protein [Clostridiales Family XIII bacterium]